MSSDPVPISELSADASITDADTFVVLDATSGATRKATASQVKTYTNDHTHSAYEDDISALESDVGDLQALTSSGDMDGNARVGVRLDSTGSPLQRRTLNLIQGSNITINVDDDSGNEEIDIEIAADTTGFASGTVTGQVIQWDGAAWAPGITIYTGSSEPGSPSDGDIWFDTSA